ncbi:histone H1t [Neofelis nebulosa]|uniref:histone H1t n=1 Tax=Neofelis nebulosa TaxID=61452 RepID=UPI00272A185D|nr:histone H1t [Neofelis nebulosa]
MLLRGFVWDPTFGGKTNTKAPPPRGGAVSGDAPITARRALYKALRLPLHPYPTAHYALPGRSLLCFFLRDMSETVPVSTADTALAPVENPPAKRRGRKPVGMPGSSRKTPSLSVSKLITEALAVSQERAGMSLAALKKALAAAGYDVEKNSNRIQLGLKSLVSKGILVQIKGTGASGSFKLNKKAIPETGKSKVKRPTSAKAKKLISKHSKSRKSAKTTQKAKKPRAATAPKAPRGSRKAKGGRGRWPAQSPGKARAGEPKAGKAKVTEQKTSTRQVASKK